jgi:hypothetical protein
MAINTNTTTTTIVANKFGAPDVIANAGTGYNNASKQAKKNEETFNGRSVINAIIASKDITAYEALALYWANEYLRFHAKYIESRNNRVKNKIPAKNKGIARMRLEDSITQELMEMSAKLLEMRRKEGKEPKKNKLGKLIFTAEEIEILKEFADNNILNGRARDGFLSKVDLKHLLQGARDPKAKDDKAAYLRGFRNHHRPGVGIITPTKEGILLETTTENYLISGEELFKLCYAQKLHLNEKGKKITTLQEAPLEQACVWAATPDQKKITMDGLTFVVDQQELPSITLLEPDGDGNTTIPTPLRIVLSTDMYQACFTSIINTLDPNCGEYKKYKLHAEMLRKTFLKNFGNEKFIPTTLREIEYTNFMIVVSIIWEDRGEYRYKEPGEMEVHFEEGGYAYYKGLTHAAFDDFATFCKERDEHEANLAKNSYTSKKEEPEPEQEEETGPGKFVDMALERMQMNMGLGEEEDDI